MEILPLSRLWPTERLDVCRNLLSIQEMMVGPIQIVLGCALPPWLKSNGDE